MDRDYHRISLEMEKEGADADYIVGWQGGYLCHPKREEQRQTKAYEAGYQDGRDKNAENYKNWVKPESS